MSGNIKGITLEIGGETTPLKKALNEMSAITAITQKELNAVNKSLKFDPKNVDLLNQKEELLAKKLEDTRIKVDKLKTAKEKADNEMKNGTEVNQEQYRMLVREISAAEGQLKSLIRQTDKFGNAAREIGGKIEGIGKKGMALSGAVVGIGAAVVSLPEATREYRTEIAKLETAFTTSNFSAQDAQNTYIGLYSVLGETDQAVEASNHLAKLCQTEEQLASWTDICTGVYATFGASLPIEGLTEAANETAKVGQVTGPLADALNWAGVSEDEFNKKLEKCTNEQERAQLITETLTGLYSDAAKTYRELNGDTLAVNEAQVKLKNSTAELGEKISAKLTPLMEIAADKLIKVVDAASEMDDTQLKVIAGIGLGVAAIPPLLIGTGKMITAIGVISTAYKQMAASATLASVAAKAIPFIGVAAGVIGLVSVIGQLVSSTEEENMELRKLHDAYIGRYEDYQKTKQAAQEQAEASLAEITYVENLKDELVHLADENGRVAESERLRAEFILNQLNDALGTEYKMTGLLIDDYGELSNAIDTLITKKRAEIILSSKEEAAKKAREAIETQKEALVHQQNVVDFLQNTYDAYKANADLTKKSDQEALERLGQRLDTEKDALAEMREAEKSYREDIKDYEDAYISYMEDGGKALNSEWEDRTTVLTREQKKVGESFEQSVVDLADYARKYKQGMEGYTEEGLKELQGHVEELKTEGEKIGLSINEGMVVGISDTEEVKTAVSDLCNLIPDWAKGVLGINSPAKKTIPIGEAIPQGIAVGVEKDMSAEEALEKKCKNLENILKEYTDEFDLNINLAESEYDLFLLKNPEASQLEKLTKQEEMLNKQYAEQESKVQAINDALYLQIQLTDEESVESKKLLLELNNERKAYEELADAIEKVNKEKAEHSGNGSSGALGNSGGRSAASAYAAYHVQYGAMLKSQGVSQEAIDAAARKVSGYEGERSISITQNISGVTADTAYKVSQETAKVANNLAMQGVL